MTPTAADAPERRPGRPRSLDADRAILDAALEELADVGVGGVAMESVAARAGVAKSTVYRRWASRDALLLDAIAGLDHDQQWTASRPTVREELVAMLDAIRERSGGHIIERLLPRLVAAAHEHPELMRAYAELVVEPRREHVRTVLRRGVESGELHADLDVDLAVKAVVFPMLYAIVMRTDVTPVPPDFSGRMVDLLMRGLAP